MNLNNLSNYILTEKTIKYYGFKYNELYKMENRTIGSQYYFP